MLPELVNLPALPYPHHQGEFSSTAGDIQCHYHQEAGSVLLLRPQGQLIYTHASKVFYIMLPRQGSESIPPNLLKPMREWALLLSHPLDWLTCVFTIGASSTDIPGKMQRPLEEVLYPVRRQC